MSRTNETERRIPDPDLDRELAAMAADAPEMPADFHAGWVKAIREESAKREQPAKEQAAPRGTVRQWRRLAGAAAVMVFLIGGTLLTRGRWNRETAGVNHSVSAKTAVSGEASPASGFSVDAAGAERPNAGAGAMDAEAPGEMITEEAASYGEASYEEASYEAADEAAEEPAAETAPDTAVFAAALRENAAETGAAEEEAEEETEAAGAAAAEADSGKTAGAAEPSRKAGTEAAGAAEPAAEAREEPEKPEEAGGTPAEVDAGAAETEAPANGDGIGGFFADMGQFILHVWPYVAGLAILGGIIRIGLIRKKKT